MSTTGFLIDENLPSVIAAQLRRHAPLLRVFAIHDPAAPLKGTVDPEILIWLEENNCWLVTNNRTSMPGHLQEHLNGGRHVPGIFVTPYPLHLGFVIEELLLLWGASLPDEYLDRIVYLPVS